MEGVGEQMEGKRCRRDEGKLVVEGKERECVSARLT